MGNTKASKALRNTSFVHIMDIAAYAAAMDAAEAPKAPVAKAQKPAGLEEQLVKAQAEVEAARAAKAAVEHLRVHPNKSKGSESRAIHQNPKVAAADRRLNNALAYLNKVQKRLDNLQEKADREARKQQFAADQEAKAKADAKAKAWAEEVATRKENAIKSRKVYEVNGELFQTCISLNSHVYEIWDEIRDDLESTQRAKREERKARRLADAEARKAFKGSAAEKLMLKRRARRKASERAEIRGLNSLDAIKQACADFFESFKEELLSEEHKAEYTEVNKFVASYTRYKAGVRQGFYDPWKALQEVAEYLNENIDSFVFDVLNGVEYEEETAYGSTRLVMEYETLPEWGNKALEVLANAVHTGKWVHYALVEYIVGTSFDNIREAYNKTTARFNKKHAHWVAKNRK